MLGAELCYGYGASFYLEVLAAALCFISAGLNVASYYIQGLEKKAGEGTAPLLERSERGP